MCKNVCLCGCMCTVGVPDIQRDQKRVSHPLGLEL